MPKVERPPKGYLDEAVDSEWSALSANEQIETDPERYFKIAWAESYQDAERQIAEESTFERWHERKRQPRHVAQRNFAANALSRLVHISHPPKHRADIDV